LEFRKHTLKNGLEIVAECNGDAYSTALGFFVKTGSRDEIDAIAGVSHFLEHMVFKGTPTRSADDVNREFDEMGAHYNAFTNEENTVFYAAILPEYQDWALNLLADILRPSLREDDFNTEKKVIIEEIRMYDDQPPFGADEKCRALFFDGHPLARSVLGTETTVGNLTADQMRDYFRRRYSPGNIVLAAAGQVDFEALVGSLERYCGAWEPVEAGRAVAPAKPHDVFQSLLKDTSTQQYAIHLTAGPNATDTDRYAAKLLALMLGDDSGSRLYWELVDPGLAEQVSLSHYEYDGAGVFGTYMSCEPEEAADNLQRIADVYRAAQETGITEDELTQAKNKVASRVVLSSERPRGRLFTVGSDWIQRRQYRSVRDDLDAVAALTLDEVTAVLKQYPLTRGTTVTIGPLDEVRAPM
jgi:predicted Zn-dependent peptidase